MMVPGSDLLDLAMSVINPQSFFYVEYIGRTSNDIGIYQTEYAEPVASTGSVQPIARNLYEHMGLDFQKNYHTFFVSRLIGDVARAKAGDKFIYNNKTWQCLSTTPWYAMDGWTECHCVEIPNEENYYINQNGLPYTTEDGLQFYTTE